MEEVLADTSRPTGWRRWPRRHSAGANGIRVLRPGGRAHHQHQAEQQAEDEAAQEGQVGVDQAEVADGQADDAGQAHVAEAHPLRDEEPDGEEDGEGRPRRRWPRRTRSCHVWSTADTTTSRGTMRASAP